MSIEQQTQNILNTWLKYGVIKRKGDSFAWTTRTIKEHKFEPLIQTPEEAAKEAVMEYEGIKRWNG